MSAVEVLMSDDDWALGRTDGARRQAAALELKRQDQFGAEQDAAKALQYHQDGCCGELAFSKFSGLPYVGFSDAPSKLEGDVGPEQVRSTRWRTGCLLVHETRDKDWPRYWLVVIAPPICRVVGYLYGHEAKRQEWWNTRHRNPAFFVPQTALRAPNTWKEIALPKEPRPGAGARLRCKEALNFMDGVLGPGTEVVVMKPTPVEERGASFSGGLLEDEARDPHKDRWFIIEWNGLRRRVPRRAFA